MKLGLFRDSLTLNVHLFVSLFKACLINTSLWHNYIPFHLSILKTEHVYIDTFDRGSWHFLELYLDIIKILIGIGII